ncbi:hypothetical protein DPMN_164702 [Dreissena polymorpha]|uniref:Uncharacterized protein n=1 Tax=Dreissena polymorpha TaxID=45954 RepID=A0A9D4EU38_DREPO|nr:hypothetical protein DPMN_164702 [Dreissena polymorpha]
MSMSELARHSPQLDIRDFCRMSMSELARHSLQLDIRFFCRMSMSDLARHSCQFDNREFCRMSMSELARHSSQLDIRMSIADVSANFTHLYTNDFMYQCATMTKGPESILSAFTDFRTYPVRNCRYAPVKVNDVEVETT